MSATLSSAEVVDRLNALGFRPTTPRYIILNHILSQPGHFSAQDVYDRLRESHPHIGRATIFRTIELLEKIGALEALHLEDGRHGYTVCGTGHHHHLICTNCGRAIQVEDSEIESLIQQLGARHGFRPTAHRLEISGLCEDCAA